MSEDLVRIEVNGLSLEGKKGQMLIEITDAAGIPIPRFCYHKKLSVAANCRMCLVEVEKAPKPLPACATPVMDGMKVWTQSPKALAAQKGTMEFLLINHPLDCPICDQGGECELQDVAVGYGRDVSSFSERKRTVPEKNIGPLIATEMTRCIHCTRCVRFGEEVAGLREMGAVGRGEFTEIGTFVARSVESEVSANVIDLCPVGALTAKPSRYSHRPWELVQHEAVSPHDSLGSNMYLHTRRGELLRAVPRENEAVNEVWLSDRDRFSYEGVRSEQRLKTPLLRKDGKLQPVSWEEALEGVAHILGNVRSSGTANKVGVLASPYSTVEELYLLQKLMRSVGIANIDHRLTITDDNLSSFSPVVDFPVAQLENVGTAVLIGCDLHMEQPLLGVRLRKAALKGADVIRINPLKFASRFDLSEDVVLDPYQLVPVLVALIRAVAASSGQSCSVDCSGVDVSAVDGQQITKMAEILSRAKSAVVMVGRISQEHPDAGSIVLLSRELARLLQGDAMVLPVGGNSVGAYYAGCLPDRAAGGRAATGAGLTARQMLGQPCDAYILYQVEVGCDVANPAVAESALRSAQKVVAFSSYLDGVTEKFASIVLPVAAFSETSGTYVNMNGLWQSFSGAVAPCGSARPGWKVLRVLGNMLDLPDFQYESSEDVLSEVKQQCGGDMAPAVDASARPVCASRRPDGLVRVGHRPVYASDPVVRRATALQESALAQSAAWVVLHPDTAAELRLSDGCEIVVHQGNSGVGVRMGLRVDTSVPVGVANVPSGLAETSGLADAYDTMTIVAA